MAGRSLFMDDEDSYTPEGNTLYTDLATLFRPILTRAANEGVSMIDTSNLFHTVITDVIRDVVYARNNQRELEDRERRRADREVRGLELTPTIPLREYAGRVRMATVMGDNALRPLDPPLLPEPDFDFDDDQEDPD